MIIKTIEKRFLEYNEIPKRTLKKCQKMLKEHYRDNDLDALSDTLYEELCQLLLDRFLFMEVYPSDIDYSLDYCQGDGFSFTTYNIDKFEFIEHYLATKNKHLPSWCIDILAENIASLCIKRINSKYSHSKTVQARIETICSDNNILVNNFYCELEEHLEMIKEEICKEMEKEGYEIIEWIDKNLEEYTKDFWFVFIEDNITIIRKGEEE